MREEKQRNYKKHRLTHKNLIRGQLSKIFANLEYNQNRQNFSFSLKKRRPLWKDVLSCAATSFGLWIMAHVGLNFGAFQTIAEYKVETLQASVFEHFGQEKKQILEIKETKKESLKINKVNAKKKVFSEMYVNPSDNRIFISRINKNVPLVNVPNHQNWNELENNIQKGLQGGVVVHPVSHSPGNFGNFFLTGHSSYYAWDDGRYKEVFALLHELQEGDIIEVFWEGKKYKYKLNLQKIVPPTETAVLNQPTDKSIITLMTCTPIGTNTNRLIWVGELLED